MEKIHVILRTCLNSLLDKNIDRTHINYIRICGSDRSTMILKCLNSLITTINNSCHNISFTILDDHSDASFIKEVKKSLKQLKIKYKFVNLKQRGFNHSSYEQFKLAIEKDELIYVIEDDYLHEKNAIDQMYNAYHYFTERFKDNVLIFPFDCPYRYIDNREEPTVLFNINKRYWRHVKYTTLSFFTHSSILKNNFEMYERMALEYPNVCEDNTINLKYKGLNPKENETIIAFNPIPSLAYHIAYIQPPEIDSECTNWKNLWNKIEL